MVTFVIINILLLVTLIAFLIIKIKSYGRSSFYRALHINTFEKMLELSETEVYIFEPGSYKIRWVNHFAKKNTGYSRLKLLSSTVMILNPSFSLERLDAGLSSLVKGEENFKLFTTTFVRSNGSKYPVEVNIFFDKSMNIFVATAHDITAKKEMFKAFEENVAVLSTMLQHMPDLIWRQDENGSIIFCNSSMEKFLAKKNKEIVSKKISEIFDSDSASKIDTVTSQAWSSGAIAIDTIDINFNNSGKIFFEITAVPIKDRKSNVESILVIAHNITEKIMAHEALRDSEDLYRKFIDASDDLIFLKDQNLNYVIVNLANARFFDKKISDIIGKSDFDLMDYNLALQCRDSDIKAMESGALIISDEEHHGKVYESRKFPVYTRNGKKFIGGYIRDITESVNLARNLEISANQWRQTFDSIDDMIWLLDRDFTIVRANKSSEKFLNLKPQKLIGKKCWEVIHNSYMPPETCPYNSIKNNKIFENCFIEMNDKFFSVSLFPVVDNSGSMDSIVHIVRDITKEKQAEKQLLESEELFRSLFENHSAIKLILDPDGGKIIEANEAAVDFYGWSKEELKSMSIMQINTLTPEEIQAEINKVKEKKKVHFNFRHRRADGSIRDVEVYSSAINIRGKVYLHSIVHDVTDKKQAEKDLMILVEATRQAASGIVITDINGNIVYANPAFLNMTMYEFGEVIGKNPRDILKSGLHGKDFYQSLWDTILSGKVWHGDIINRRKDGTLYTEEMTVSSVRDESGKIINFIAVKQDVSRRREIEQQLRNSEKRFKAIVDTQPVAVCRWDKNFKITYANEYYRVLFHPSGDIIGICWLDFIPEDSREAVRNFYYTVIEKPHQFDYEHEVKLADGTTRHLFWSDIPIYDDHGNLLEFQSVGTDITDRKKAEIELRKNYNYTRIIQDILKNSMAKISLEEFLENALFAIFTIKPLGYNPEAIVLLSDLEKQSLNVVASIGFQDDKTKCLERGFVVFDKCPCREVFEEKKSICFISDAAFAECRNNVSTYICSIPLKYKSDILGVINIAVDREYSLEEDDLQFMENVAAILAGVILLKRAEDLAAKTLEELEFIIDERTSELKKANKELEAFTYSVSHDLRAPLRHISGFLEMFKNEVGDLPSPRANHYLSVISDSVKKMTQLIDDLLKFSRLGRASIECQKVSLEKIKNEIINDFSMEIEKSNCRVISDNILPDVKGDPSMLRVVLINLISNAIKFSSKVAEPEIHLGSMEQNEEIIFYVRDNGVGFDMRYADKLFNVFQRLHSDREFEGTGIGLAMVRNIIEKHNGRVWAEAKPGEGAIFYFTLAKP